MRNRFGNPIPVFVAIGSMIGWSLHQKPLESRRSGVGKTWEAEPFLLCPETPGAMLMTKQSPNKYLLIDYNINRLKEFAYDNRAEFFIGLIWKNEG